MIQRPICKLQQSAGFDCIGEQAVALAALAANQAAASFVCEGGIEQVQRVLEDGHLQSETVCIDLLFCPVICLFHSHQDLSEHGPWLHSHGYVCYCCVLAFGLDLHVSIYTRQGACAGGAPGPLFDRWHPGFLSSLRSASRSFDHSLHDSRATLHGRTRAELSVPEPRFGYISGLFGHPGPEHCNQAS